MKPSGITWIIAIKACGNRWRSYFGFYVLVPSAVIHAPEDVIGDRNRAPGESFYDCSCICDLHIARFLLFLAEL